MHWLNQKVCVVHHDPQHTVSTLDTYILVHVCASSTPTQAVQEPHRYLLIGLLQRRQIELEKQYNKAVW